MNVVIDMNLSPRWEESLAQAGFGARHWSRIGSPSASDAEILAWARAEQHILLTHDLDFGAILAASGAKAPSVLLLRAQDVSPEAMSCQVVNALTALRATLDAGALVSLDPRSARARVLPLTDR